MGKKRKLLLAVFMCTNLILSSVFPVYAAENVETIEGTETSVTEKTENVPELTLDVKPGETDTQVSIPEPPVTTGDLKEDDSDMEYDQTTTSETPRQATITTGKVEITEGTESGEATLSSPIPDSSLIDVDVPEKDIQEHAYSPTVYDSDNPEDCEYRYTGYGQESSIGINNKDSDDDSLAHHYELTDVDDEENKQYVYCSDYVTSALRGYYYDVENLEQSSYYSEEEKNHIRAIAEYVYWGTASGYGSLESLKAVLEADVLEGKLEDFGIDELTEGEAITASQAAIWYFAKGGNSVDYTDPAGDGADDESSARVKALVDYLLTLSKTEEEATATQIIHDYNFLKPDSMKLTVKDKVQGAAENQDDDDRNDLYNAEISFAMTVIPNTLTDDLLIIITDENGNVVKTARIAGTNKDDETYEMLNPEQDGVYIIRDIKLNEGKTVFNLKLQGTQYLEQGVYIYTSETYNETNSQTFVGIAEGTRNVDVSMKVAFEVSVDEGEVTTVHEWKKVKKEEIEDPEDPDDPVVYVRTTPKTGDSSPVMLLVIASAVSLGVVIVLLGYVRRKNM